jgi:hypothetical protein
MIDKTITLENAIRNLHDEETVMVGGFGVPGTPFTLINGLLQAGVSNLTLIKNEANEDGLGLSKLVEAGRAAKLITSHLGLNATVIGIASQLLIIVTFFQLSDGIQVVAQGALRGLSDTRTPTVMTFISYWVVSLPMAYFLGFHTELGVIGIWIGLAAGLTMNAILLFRRFMKKANQLVAKDLATVAA